MLNVLVCIHSCLFVSVYEEPGGPTATLFINTSVGLTVHSRGELRGRELQHSPHKKSLLIYFPPNWKVHAHTWLNHHASTGDGPPPHTCETWAQLCCTVLGRQDRKNTRVHRTPCNGLCRCAGPDSPFLNTGPTIQRTFIKFVMLCFFLSIFFCFWSGWPQNAL